MGKLGARVLLGIPTLRSARRSVAWIDSMANLQMPLGSSLGRYWIEDETIAAARNALCEKAIAEGIDYVVFLGDDVLPPPNMLLLMLERIGREFPVEGGQVAKADLITGVYWTKTYPSEPYLWNGLLKGSYRDWTAGEFVPVDLAGCDALMIDTRILRETPRPWFSTEWVWEEGQKPSSIATEDFYFFTKARMWAGARLFVDTSIQCLHEDRATGHFFGLRADMPQAGGVPECGESELLVAEVGAGTDSPSFGPNAKVVRFDARDDVRPDVRCDVRGLPEEHFGKYDLVHTRHVLEHFGRAEAPGLLRHWAKLLKVGGKIVIRVPNLEHAMRRILDGTPDNYHWAQLYGGQMYELDYHKNGFTARKLRGLLSTHPCLGDVEVAEEDDGQNLCGTARLVRADEPEALTKMWDEIARREAPKPPVTEPAYEAAPTG